MYATRPHIVEGLENISRMDQYDLMKSESCHVILKSKCSVYNLQEKSGYSETDPQQIKEGGNSVAV